MQKCDARMKRLDRLNAGLYVSECCSVLPRVVVCCSVLQFGAVWCSHEAPRSIQRRSIALIWVTDTDTDTHADTDIDTDSETDTDIDTESIYREFVGACVHIHTHTLSRRHSLMIQHWKFVQTSHGLNHSLPLFPLSLSLSPSLSLSFSLSLTLTHTLSHDTGLHKFTEKSWAQSHVLSLSFSLYHALTWYSIASIYV